MLRGTLNVCCGVSKYAVFRVSGRQQRAFRGILGAHGRCHNTNSSIAKVFNYLNVMPKTRDAEPAEESRIAKRIDAMDRKRPAAEIYLQVIGNGSKGGSRSLYVFTDQWRYLFNCGEGTQRLAHEYKIKLGKLEHLFVTHGSWANIGGLPGLMLTIQDIGVQKVALHGPNGIEKLFNMTKGFMMTDDIEIEKKNVEDKVYEDQIMSIKYITIYGPNLEKASPQPLNSINEEMPDYYDHQRSTKLHKKRRDQLPVQKKQKTSSSSDASNSRDVSVAFICRCTNKPGMLLLEKCVDYGVPPGPLLGQLKNGKDVILPNGTAVKSADVVSPEEPGPVFIVVECPSVEFLDSLLKADGFARHQAGAEHAKDLAALVVHFTPSDVMNTEKYQEWMQRFHPSTEHLLINDNSRGPSSYAVHRIQHKLNLLHPNIFPLLNEEMNEDGDPLPKSPDGMTFTCLPSKTLFKYHLRPLKRADSSAVVSIDVQEFHDECSNAEGFPEALSELKSRLRTMTPATDDAHSYPEVLFLGTGSSIPSKVRNTSCILIRLSSNRSIMFDCAEGSFSQLYRHFGSDTNRILQNLRAIFVSHLHADHHLGLIELLKQRRNAFKHLGLEYAPVELIAPQQIMPWLQQYHQTFEPVLENFRLFPNLWFTFGRGTYDDKEYRDLITDLDLKQLEVVQVQHCFQAFGIAMTHRKNWKIVYSGDTMPCQSLVNAGMDCDLLIHEATMEDDLKMEAIMKKHSTTSQAIQQGIAMNAKFTLLTHFSQRYAKVPIFTDNFGNNVGIAFDNLKVTLNDLQVLPHLKESLQAMFAEDYEDMQDKTAKKLRQRSKQEAKALASAQAQRRETAA